MSAQPSIIGQPLFFVTGPENVTGDILSSSTGSLGSNVFPFQNSYLTGTSFADIFSSRLTQATTGQITGLTVANLYVLNILPVSQPNLGSFAQPWGDLHVTGTGYMDLLSARIVAASTGQITGLSVSNLYPVGQPNLGQPAQRWNNLYATGTGYLDRVETKSEYSNSGVFNYLGPTGVFFPPLLTLQQRTGWFTGYSTTGITPYDGAMVYQTNSGQKLMVVQSGIWKTATLT